MIVDTPSFTSSPARAPLPTLGSALLGQANNFGLARLFAALFVVLTHTYAIANLDPGELYVHLVNKPYPYVGNYAVESFFVISGLLVTRSFLSGRQSVARYCAARALRLYPALVCGVLLSLLLALVCNSRTTLDAAARDQAWSYLWNNATGLRFIGTIDGAFPGNALAGAPNGSLWTIPIELRMYVLVALLGLLGALRRTWIAATVLVAAIGALMASAVSSPWLWDPAHDLFAVAFMLGMLAYLLRDRLPLSFAAGGALLVLFLGTAVWAEAAQTRIVFAFCLPYWLLLLTCHPAIPAVRLPGDYSYGIYVYAFPLQQTLAWTLPEIGAPLALATTFGCVVGVAVLSWHWIEKPLLDLKPQP